MLVAATVLVSPVAYMAMFTGFHAYDDEGYFLLLLRDYMGGQPLLSPATPIYGPFFFETMAGLLKALGLAPDHDTGRLVTLALWLLTILLGAATVYGLTRSLWLSAGSLLIGFHALTALTTEPMSPQALIAILTIALAAAATMRESRPRLTAALVGAIVAALCLIKINVGFFAGVAVVVAWAAGLSGRQRRIVLPVVATAFVVLPFALTSTMLAKPWALEFGAAVSLASGAVAIAMWHTRPRSGSVRDAAWIPGGGAALAAVCLGIAVVGGTTPAEIWNGLVVVSLRFPTVFTAPIEINPFFDVVAAVSFVAAVLVSVSGGRVRVTPATRVVVGLSIWVALILLPTTIFLITIPAAWVALVVPADEMDDPIGPYARAFLPALAIANTLQAYPVAGTQLSLAALPQLMVGAICLVDGLRTARRAGISRAFATVVSRGALALGALAFLVATPFTVSTFQGATPLGLRGAQSVRLPSAQARDLQTIVAALGSECSTFITYPGMNSFYIWTGQRPPTDVRSEVWMITFDSKQQQALVSSLSSESGLCVVKDEREVEFWTRGVAVPDRPLVRYIADAFTVAATAGDYQLLVRNPSHPSQ